MPEHYISNKAMDKVYFREEQRYTQWWVWLLLLLMFFVAVVPLWYGVYIQTVEGRPWGNQPITTDKLVVVSIVVTLFVSAIVILFFVQKLETVVSSDGVRYRYPPFIRKWKKIKPQEIFAFSIDTYKPLATYGGWGIRSGSKREGKAYTISGKTGLKITLVDRSKILIGTQRTDALRHAMDKMLNQ
jgi:hypothetical protein